MTDITAFISARLDEDEVLAELQPPWPWSVGDDPTEVIAEDGVEVATAFALSGNQQRNVAAYIARHDPACVLVEVKAKRAIVAMHEQAETWTWGQRPPGSLVGEPRRELAPWCSECQVEDGVVEGSWPCDTLKHLASIDADHPDYDPTWRVE
jgi:hypothetical protein